MDTLIIKNTLAEILAKLSLEFTTIDVSDPEKGSDMVRVDIASPQASRIIGWHGETINCIQHILKAMLRTQEKLDRAPFIVLDVDGYRKAQEEKVCRLAVQKADFVRRKKTRVALPPMSPYFRRVVHTYIANDPDMQDLTTESIGEGGYRQIVLMLKDGDMEDGEELIPTVSKEDRELVQEAEGGFENLDV